MSNMASCFDHPVTQQYLRTPEISVAEFACPGGPERCPEDGATGPEIVLPREGLFERRNRYGQVFADRTVVLFFDTNDPFEIHHPVQTPDSCTVISLSDRLIDELCTLPGQDASPFFAVGATLTTPSIALAHHDLLWSMFHCTTSDLIYREEKALLLVAEIFTELQKRRTSAVLKTSRHVSNEMTSGYAVADKVLLYLNENFRAEITLQGVADAVNRSPFHLCRSIKNYTGQTIHQHLTTLRLDSALKLLRTSKQPITEIALELGYSSHSHFTALFKQKFGVTPLHYRKNA